MGLSIARQVVEQQPVHGRAVEESGDAGEARPEDLRRPIAKDEGRAAGGPGSDGGDRAHLAASDSASSSDLANAVLVMVAPEIVSTWAPPAATADFAR